MSVVNEAGEVVHDDLPNLAGHTTTASIDYINQLLGFFLSFYLSLPPSALFTNVHYHQPGLSLSTDKIIQLLNKMMLPSTLSEDGKNVVVSVPATRSGMFSLFSSPNFLPVLSSIFLSID